jgi:hypothetical protein
MAVEIGASSAGGWIATDDDHAGMWTTGNDRALDVQLGMLVVGLHWLDGNDTESNKIRDLRSWCHKLGVVGPFGRNVWQGRLVTR